MANKINIPENVTRLENPSCRALPRAGAGKAVAEQNSGKLCLYSNCWKGKPAGGKEVHSERNPQMG